MKITKPTIIVLTLILAGFANTSSASEITGVLSTGLTGTVNETLTGIVVTPPVVTPTSTGGGSGGGGGTPITTPVGILSSAEIISTSSAPDLLTTLLVFGTTDSEVIILQRFLNSQGYIVSTSGSGSPSNESNYFGVKTKNALIKFQKAQGLTANLGTLDPQTINKINSIYSQSNQTTITDTQKQALIVSLRAQLASLMAQLIALLQAKMPKTQ